MFDRRVAADAGDEGRVLAGAVDRRRVAAVHRPVDDDDAGGVGQRLARLVFADRVVELGVHRLGMADEGRHAHAGRADRDLRAQDLPRLPRHLGLLPGGAVGEEGIDVGNDVESDGLAEDARFLAPVHVDRAGVVEQLVHRLLAGAGGRLVSRDDDALDPRAVVQRLQGDDHLGGRAVRVGDDIPRPIAGDRLGVHLRHDQRHVFVHAELRAVVDDDAARVGRARCVGLGDGRAGREQADVDSREVERRQVAHRKRDVLAEGDLLADRIP